MRWLRVWSMCALLAGVPSIAGAQTAGPQEPPRPTHLYLGLWSTHLNADRLHVDSNNLALGITHGSVFAATFVNSFGNRAYTAGLQRAMFSRRSDLASASLGFRLGVISGYDERFLSFAEDAPVLPMFSVYSRFELKRAGVEVSWTMVVASAAVCFRF